VLLAAARRTLRVPTALVVAAYFAITTAAMLDALPPIAAILAFGAAATLIVAKCAAPDANAVSCALSWAPLRALGRVSYSFYLVHWMIVVLIARAVEGMPPLPAAAAIFGGGFVLSTIAATILWRVAEQPYFAWTSRR